VFDQDAGEGAAPPSRGREVVAKMAGAAVGGRRSRGVATERVGAANLSRRDVVAGLGVVALLGPPPVAAAATTPVAQGATRTVEHALGTTQVPRDPTRLVALGSAVDVALAVGITPIAVDDRSAQKTYLADRLVGVPSVGPAWEPNLEQIAALDPDLILALDVSIAEVFAELTRIAPTVGVEFGETSGEWKRYNRGYAEALGRVEAFDRAMADYEAKAAAFRAAMGDRLAETEVAILRASPDNLRFDLPAIFIGDVVYNDAGLRPPPRLAEYLAENPGAATVDISPEQFTLAEGAEVLFVWQVSGQPEEDRQAIAAILGDPLLQRLEAVGQGRVYAMGNHWFSESILGADLVLDDLERHLLDDGAGEMERPGDGRATNGRWRERS